MKLGVATIGNSPRSDVVPFLRPHLPEHVHIIEAGVLDRLTPEEIANLDDETSELRLVTRGLNGASHKLSHSRIMPHVQDLVTEFERQGCELIVILCGADWSDIRSNVPVINPGKLFPNVVRSVASGLRLGVIKPDSGQVELTERQYRAMGMDPVVVSASPYVEERLALAKEAALTLKEADVDMVWMTCVGMGEEMRREVQGIVKTPCILAQSLLGKVLGELLV